MKQLTIDHITLFHKEHVLFDNLSLTFSLQQWTGFLGPSGIGKSSLLRYLADHPDLRNDTLYMAQQDALLPWLTVLDNVLLGSRVRDEPLSEKKEKAIELIEKMSLKNAIKKYPHELSGGMQKRVALIRTLLENKSIILLDEPFASLDAITRHELQQIAFEFLNNKTVFLVTHDPLEALQLCHEIMILTSPTKIETLNIKTLPPRQLNDASMMQHHATLLKQLIIAKEKMI